MTIEIISTSSYTLQPTGETFRHCEIIISDGTDTYRWGVGGLPMAGNLQTILNAREPELWAGAQAEGRPVDLYELTVKRVLRAFALVMLDEINILRVQAGLPARTAAQAEAALKAKLKTLA